METKPTNAAQKACCKWLADCISHGWPKSSLDGLERTWWEHHDANGALKASPAPVAQDSNSGQRTATSPDIAAKQGPTHRQHAGEKPVGEGGGSDAVTEAYRAAQYAVPPVEVGHPAPAAQAEPPLPAGCVSLSDYIAELRRDPQRAKELDEAREPALRAIIRALLDRLPAEPAEQAGELIERLLRNAEQFDLVPASDKGIVPHDSARRCAATLREAATALSAAQARERALESVIRWALGEEGEFPDWPADVTITGRHKYWWRTELLQRLNAALAAPTKP